MVYKAALVDLAAALLCVVLLACAGSAVAQSSDPDLRRAEALIQAGRAEQAWQLLSPHEAQHAGRPEFDYLLGIAALDSGREGLATFILERVIAVNPGHAAARLEMARAYFALRDFERAEKEFSAVLMTTPSRSIHTLIANYQEAMRRPRAGGPRLRGYVELTLGRDSNVNAATSQGSIFVPALGTDFVPAPLFGSADDAFAALGAGLEFSSPLTDRLAIFGGADLRQRMHADLDPLDSRAADLQLGLERRVDDRDSLRFTLGHNEHELDEARYRRMQSGAAEWTRLLGPRTRASLFAQGNRIRFLREEERSSSSDLLVFGVSGSHVVRDLPRTTVSGAVYLGADNATEGRADGDRGLYGMSFSLQRRLHAQVEGWATMALLNSDYRQENAAFGVTRHDRQLDTAVGISWRIAEGWFLRPQVSRTRHLSNVLLNDYRRSEASVTLRRVFP